MKIIFGQFISTNSIYTCKKSHPSHSTQAENFQFLCLKAERASEERFRRLASIWVELQIEAVAQISVRAGVGVRVV